MADDWRDFPWGAGRDFKLPEKVKKVHLLEKRERNALLRREAVTISRPIEEGQPSPLEVGQVIDIIPFRLSITITRVSAKRGFWTYQHTVRDDRARFMRKGSSPPRPELQKKRKNRRQEWSEDPENWSKDDEHGYTLDPSHGEIDAGESVTEAEQKEITDMKTAQWQSARHRELQKRNIRSATNRLRELQAQADAEGLDLSRLIEQLEVIIEQGNKDLRNAA